MHLTQYPISLLRKDVGGIRFIMDQGRKNWVAFQL
jgi:hypothetical protein